MLAMIFFIFVPLGFVEHLQSVHLTFIKFGKILTIISLNVLFCFILSSILILTSNNTNNALQAVNKCLLN